MHVDRQFWVLVERLSLFIFVAALAAPFLGAWLGRRMRRRSGHVRLGTGLGVSIGVLALPVGLWFAMCTPPVGRGATAERWYRDTAPLIAALAAYHQQRGEYPDALGDLVPAFLNPAALSIVHVEPNRSLSHQRDTAGFTLRFEYHGPGVNQCTYQPHAAEWKCSGYF
jgi:hypothetical protein